MPFTRKAVLRSLRPNGRRFGKRSLKRRRRARSICTSSLAEWRRSPIPRRWRRRRFRPPALLGRLRFPPARRLTLQTHQWRARSPRHMATHSSTSWRRSRATTKTSRAQSTRIIPVSQAQRARAIFRSTRRPGSTWLPAGIDTTKYPNAMSAPPDVQAQVASLIPPSASELGPRRCWVSNSGSRYFVDDWRPCRPIRRRDYCLASC